MLLLASTCLLALSVQQVICTTGLGEEFQPSVKASCAGGTMTIRLDTTLPFEGVIHGPNRTEPGCSVTGKGGKKTILRIDLKKSEGTAGSCGVKTNEDQERRVAIAVRAHPTIELLEDRLYVVTCGKAGFQNSRNEISVVQLEVANGNRRLNTVAEGSAYSLRARVLNHDPEFGILMKKCFAFDESDQIIQLVDDRGCRSQKLLSEFSYDDAEGTAEATLYSMFRLAHSNRTYFQCDVEICRGACKKPTCDPTAQLNTKTTKLGDPFERSEADDTITTSTSVFVAQPGSPEAYGAGLCVEGESNPSWLLWLCICFGILFCIMLFINIFLCSAMTCSCTKSEVIEKEPSIYDDYSVYDSQYGYASKVYNSESDYGSEYGIVEPEGGVTHNPPSESGTYHSKYSRGEPQPQGTLQRSRQGHGGSRYLE